MRLKRIWVGWEFAILGKMLLESRDVSTESGCIYIERTHYGKFPGLEEEVHIREE